MPRPSGFSLEVRERGIRMVLEHADEYQWQWGGDPFNRREDGMRCETLRSWFAKLSIMPASDPIQIHRERPPGGRIVCPLRSLSARISRGGGYGRLGVAVRGGYAVA